MTAKQPTTTQVLAFSAVALLIIPVFVFIASGLIRGMDLPAIIPAIGEQYLAEKNNLFIVSILGLLPLLLVGLLLLIRKFIRKTWSGSVAYALGGVIPVLLVAVFVNLEFWPKYLPARQFLGFPHGLEFIIGPFAFAPIGILFGFLFVWAVRKKV
ncbi:MAG TPA: hypothetical protein PKH39_00435 [Woeseiaceae bacterium]|nr:hypothetical protein [Woeseiaceae bacterium]